MATLRTVTSRGLNRCATAGVFASNALRSVVTNGNFETGTPPAATGWTFTVAGTSTAASVAGAGVGGGNAVRFVVDGSNSAAGVKPTATPYAIGQRIRLIYTAKVDSVAGSPFLSSDVLAFSQALTTSFVTYTQDGVITASGDLLKRGTNCASRTITIDDVTVFVYSR